MKNIVVMEGTKMVKYKSDIIPNVGDNYCNIKEFTEDTTIHYVVKMRILHRDFPDLITIIVEPK